MKCKRKQIRKWFSYRRIKLDNIKNKKKEENKKKSLSSNLKIRKKTGRRQSIPLEISLKKEEKIEIPTPNPPTPPQSLPPLESSSSNSNELIPNEIFSPFDYYLQMMIARNFIMNSHYMMVFSEWMRFTQAQQMNISNFQKNE